LLVELLINWAWQGCAVTLAAWGIIRVGRVDSATAKYQLWWAALLIVLVLPAVPPFLAMFGPSTGPGVGSGVPVAEIPIPRLPSWPVLATLGVWAIGAAIFLLRALRAHQALRRMRARSKPFPASREARLPNWMRLKVSGRRARLVISDDVRAAAVLGAGSAVIAVSPAAARTLTDSDLDLVLVHEWAHVQRHDDVGRLAQVLVRGLAWMHPAVRVIDRQLDIEREVACDDWVVNLTGGAKDLARCLTRLAVMPCSPVAQPLAPGAVAAASLSTRVRRLLDTGRSTRTRSSLTRLAPFAVTLAGITLSISGVQIVGVASSAVAPMPHSGPNLAGSLNQTMVPAPPTVRRPIDTTTFPLVVPEQPKAASSTTAPPARDVRSVPVAVTFEPLASLSPEHRTMWTPPELPVAGAPVMPGAPVTEAAVAPGTSEAVDPPWSAAAATGMSVAHGSQRAADAAADAGSSIGRGSQRAATATAGFFTRFGRRIAGRF
jgi:beta-lactamase regulating signal transducer with metallopeptidase domain